MKSYINFTIGLHGLAEVGKDTAAIIMRDELELRTYTFADPVTQECAALLNVDHAEFLARGKDSKIGFIDIAKSLNTALYQHMCSMGQQKTLAQLFNATTKRKLMQAVGNCMRANDQQAIVNNLKHRLDCNEDQNYLFNGSLITDVRLPQEAGFIHNRGGIVIHIRNPNAPAAPEDITEQHLPLTHVDYLINNNGTKEAFLIKVRELCKQLRLQMMASAA